MSDGERNPTTGSAEPAAPSEAGRRRPNPPTLDLTATEIASQAADLHASPAPDATAAVSEARPRPPDRSPSAEDISAAIEEWIRPDEPMRVHIETGDREPPLPPPPESPSPFSAAAASPPPSYFGRGVALGFLAAVLGAAAALGTLWSLGEWPHQDGGATAMTARIGTLETAVAQVANRPAAPVVSDQHIAEIVAKAVASRSAVAQPSDQIKAIEARLAKAEAALAAPPAAAADAALNERVTSLDGNAKSLATDIESLRKRLEEMAASTQAARDAAMRSSGATDNATAEVSSDLDALKQRTAALESKAAKPPADVDRVARTAAIAVALREAVERGGPYANELAAAKALAAGPAIFAPLEPFAATGLPTAAALAGELRGLAAKARSAAASAEESTGLIDRLQAHAAKLVRIRPANEAAQPLPRDFAPAEQAAARGDLPGAVAALRALPEAARAPADGWIARVEARQAVLDFARKQSSDAVAALAQQPK